MEEIKIIEIDGYKVKTIVNKPKYSRTYIHIRKGILHVYPSIKISSDDELFEKIAKYFRKNKELYLNYSPEKINLEEKIFYLLGEKIEFNITQNGKSIVFSCKKILVEDKLFRSLAAVKKFLKNYCEEKLLQHLIIRTNEIENQLVRIHHPVSINKTFRYAYARHTRLGKKCLRIEYKPSIFAYSKEIIDSIIFHELTHCLYSAHKKMFWKTLFSYYPEEKYKLYDKKLALNNFK
ncbi:YgjP-like metallopeptidase domain-containing protein [Mesomycoplasma molare]|uniref:DUF45 domain-containing protein n=1 Tax=Mesomycoplasma molare TaxID=171288 RepID=A0ABY5TU00_9BACT|nr:YgjP-like metallopeptidase domain-containing protein [Mesomycoplasma molare]UWD34147.1 DUF45 domain-containing protein [Mesomycoplasma molare]